MIAGGHRPKLPRCSVVEGLAEVREVSEMTRQVLGTPPARVRYTLLCRYLTGPMPKSGETSLRRGAVGES